jgi:hypothetical protein
VNWFLIIASVATYSTTPGRYIGPLDEMSCKGAAAALSEGPASINVWCKQAVGVRICQTGQRPQLNVTEPYIGVAACPVFEGDIIRSGPK